MRHGVELAVEILNHGAVADSNRHFDACGHVIESAMFRPVWVGNVEQRAPIARIFPVSPNFAPSLGAAGSERSAAPLIFAR